MSFDKANKSSTFSLKFKAITRSFASNETLSTTPSLRLSALMPEAKANLGRSSDKLKRLNAAEIKEEYVNSEVGRSQLNNLAIVPLDEEVASEMNDEVLVAQKNIKDEEMRKENEAAQILKRKVRIVGIGITILVAAVIAITLSATLTQEEATDAPVVPSFPPTLPPTTLPPVPAAPPSIIINEIERLEELCLTREDSNSGSNLFFSTCRGNKVFSCNLLEEGPTLSNISCAADLVCGCPENELLVGVPIPEELCLTKESNFCEFLEDSRILSDAVLIRFDNDDNASNNFTDECALTSISRRCVSQSNMQVCDDFIECDSERCACDPSIIVSVEVDLCDTQLFC